MWFGGNLGIHCLKKKIVQEVSIVINRPSSSGEKNLENTEEIFHNRMRARGTFHPFRT